METLRSVIMETLRSVIVEAFMDRFTAAELLPYKEVLFEEATEEWYTQRDPDEADHVQRQVLRLCSFNHHRKCGNTFRELRKHYTSQLDNLYDTIEG